VAVGGKKEVVAQLKAAGEDGVVDLSCVLPMEKLLAEAARLEALREKEQGELLRMDKDKAVRARHLQIEARRRSEMEQQRKLRREQEDRYHEMVDAQRSKALDHAQRLKEQRIEREKATQEKRQRREAKMAAVADKMQKEEEELQKKEVELNSKFATMSMRAGSPMGGTMSTPRGGAGGRGSPRRMASPRMLRMSSPGRRGSVGSGAGSPLGRPSTASGKAEAIASRRMEEEMAALERRIQRCVQRTHPFSPNGVMALQPFVDPGQARLIDPSRGSHHLS
jgi:flagellar biosynthesis GTPase FlhF